MAFPYTLFGVRARGSVASPRLCNAARPHRLGADEDTSKSGVAWRGIGVPPPRHTPACGRGRPLPALFGPLARVCGDRTEHLRVETRVADPLQAGSPAGGQWV